MRLAFAVIIAAGLATPVAAQQTNQSTVAPTENVATSVDENQQAPPPIPTIALPATEATADESAPPTRPVARRSTGFPWGLIGLVGLVGLLGRRRS